MVSQPAQNEEALFAPELTEQQEKQVEKVESTSLPVIHEVIRMRGEQELARSKATLFWSGLAAGLSMGFSLIAEGLLQSRLPHARWSPLISRIGYSFGFIVVILGRQQLFTENTLTVILPLLLHKDRATVLKVLRLWSIVLTTNVVGTFLFALTIARLHFLEPAIQQSVLEVAHGHIGPGFWTVLLRGIFAGWLIALMVWMLPDAATSRVVVILIITYLISISGLSHIIAGSTNVFFLVASGKLPIARYFTAFFFPTLLGNIFGGVSLVAALAHGQVVGGKT